MPEVSLSIVFWYGTDRVPTAGCCCCMPNPEAPLAPKRPPAGCWAPKSDGAAAGAAPKAPPPKPGDEAPNAGAAPGAPKAGAVLPKVVPPNGLLVCPKAWFGAAPNAGAAAAVAPNAGAGAAPKAEVAPNAGAAPKVGAAAPMPNAGWVGCIPKPVGVDGAPKPVCEGGNRGNKRERRRV